MSQLQAVILAAGQGTRMKSRLPKVLHRVAGKAMVDHVAAAARAAGAGSVLVVVGYELEQLQRHFEGQDVQLVQQTPQLGTGHAVQQAAPLLARGDGEVVVLYGDAPLLQADSLRQLVAEHRQAKAQLSLLTATVPDPQRIARIVQEGDGRIAIREWADASEAELAITEVNPGVYCFDRAWLLAELPTLTLMPKGEYYLTELVSRAQRVRAVHSDAIASYVDIGVDTRQALAEAEARFQQRLRTRWMAEGVTFVDPPSVFLDSDTCLAQDCTIYPNTFISASNIGEGSVIGPGSRIEGCTIGRGCTIRESVLESSILEDEVQIGPFCHLRPDSYVEAGATLGNYVEIKNARIGRDTQIHHFSYTGDAELGRRVNIGAGTITCNYNSETGVKSRTILEDDVSTGSDTLLVAPVRLGAGSMTGSGSVVTKDVAPGMLALGMPARALRHVRTCSCGHERLAHNRGTEHGCAECDCPSFHLNEVQR